MKTDSIKAVLVGLGMVGSVALGAGATTVITNLPTPNIDTPAPDYVCEGEQLQVSKVPICMDAMNYGIVKSALKDKLNVNGHVNVADFPLHIAILDNEIKKQGGITVENFNGANDLFTSLTLEFL